MSNLMNTGKISSAPLLLSLVLDGVFLLAASALAFLLVHRITAKRLPFYLPAGKLLANLVCYMLVCNGFYLLIARAAWAGVFGSLALLLLATANYYVYRFKGTELAITDFYAIGTAKNVASHYSYTPERQVILAWLIWLGFSVLALVLYRPEGGMVWLRRCAALALELLLLAVFLLFTKNVRGTHWDNEGSLNYGYLLNFMLGVKGLFGLRPSGYRPDHIREIARQDPPADAVEPQVKRSPDIIVIMNESFADLSVLGAEPNTNVPVLPVFHGLRENTVKGFALSSVYGGTTANSEYEFLTGNSMAFFPYGSIPYMQYIHGEAYSLTAELKRQGYRCMATHPYLASGWARPTVYPSFGFDKITFEEAYPKRDVPRGYISDAEMYDYITEQYGKLGHEDKLFLFGVTVQNHGDYAGRSQMVENTVWLKDEPGKYPDVDQYLTLLHRSDQAIEKLISYFSGVNRDVVLCFFGDHLPRLEPAFLEQLHGGRFDKLDEQQKTKLVPFFIWANYPLEQKTLECTSLNYLATHLLEAAGLKLPAYRQFLKKLEQEIPAVNADGYYSVSKNGFRPIDEASGREAELLRDYRMMVYNNALDRTSRDADLFPTR